MPVKLSIITVNLNNAPGLESTLSSVQKQTFRDFELIVIDGGSTDGSLQVLEKFRNTVSYFISEKDQGIYDGQNKGILKSKGEYVQFLNSGDELADPDVLKKIFDTAQDADLIYGDVILVNGANITGRKPHPEELTIQFFLKDTITHQAQIIKTELFRKSGMYNLRYRIAADYEFLVRIFKLPGIKFSHIPVDIVAYDISGFSSRPELLALHKVERREIQFKYLPFFPVFIYQAYSRFVSTGIYNSPLIFRFSRKIKNLFSGQNG